MSQLRTRNSPPRAPLSTMRRAAVDQPVRDKPEMEIGMLSMEVVEEEDFFVAGFLRPLRPEPQTEEERSSNPEDGGSIPPGASTVVEGPNGYRQIYEQLDLFEAS